ncbi:MAG: hypothetical protein AB8E82_04430 [Aureispira sp.]
MDNNKYLGMLSGSMLVILFLPLLQGFFGFWKEAPLQGAFEKKEAIDWSVEDWLSGDYQSAKDAQLRQQFGGSTWAVRWHNQYWYSLLGMATNTNLVLGKDNYIFEKIYIDEVEGKNYVGDAALQMTANYLAFIQQKMAERGQLLVTVLAPNKARYYPDYLPEGVQVEEVVTNYKVLRQKLKAQQVNVLDVEAWFMEARATAEYPLFPAYGTHWSVYGMALFVDSLVHYIGDKTNRPVAQLVIDSLWMSAELQEPDNDLGELLNVACPLPAAPMPYYKAHFEMNEQTFKPRLLAIGDSFWGTYSFREQLSKACFTNPEYWYYYKTMFPSGNTRQENDRAAFDEQDVIIIEVTTGNIPNFGWGALSDLRNHYNTIDNIYVERMEKKIRGDAAWLAAITAKAKERGLSTDEMITLDAQYMVKEELKLALKDRSKVCEDI